MFQALRTRINTTTIVAVFALVFAMTGGAYAAKKYLITSTKQISPSVLKSLQGKAGRAGAAGVNGAPGAPGPQGPAGTNGTNGVGTEGKEGKQGKEGKEGKQGKEGPAGAIQPGETLPAGATETGVWSSGLFKEEGASTAAVMSFTIPLAGPLDEGHVHYVRTEEVESGTGPELEHCPGTVESPQADSGNLCLYQGLTQLPGEEGELQVLAISPPTVQLQPQGASTAGAIATVKYTGPAGTAQLKGTWAVTG